MVRRILAYECQYCETLKRTKNIAVRHEKSCPKNPNAQNCIFCVHPVKLEACAPGGGKLWCPVRSLACSSAVGAGCEQFVRKERQDKDGDVRHG